ncbi:MAG: glycosyltransferase [Novosphingobium sp.]|nr:glycosyltransferase [Novosphingobium sp.]
MSEKISILIPVYNREGFIERAINSSLNQTYKNLQILVYDDGSNDKTREIVIDIAQKDNRVKLFCNTPTKNEGVGKARNLLLKFCDTKYAIWQDSDDISAPTRIEEQLKEMTEDKMVYCTWENFKTKVPGTTRGFATLMFPVNKGVLFPEDMKFGGEDQCWRDEMEKIYPTSDVNQVLYSIDFHGNRIGTWKRKIDKNWNGKYDLNDIKDLSYEDAIKKYMNEYQTK